MKTLGSRACIYYTMDIHRLIEHGIPDQNTTHITAEGKSMVCEFSKRPCRGHEFQERGNR